MNATEALQRSSVSMDNLERLVLAGRLYAILDACDAPSVPARVRELGRDQAVSLYRGGAEEGLWAIAPYLVRVSFEVLDWILDVLSLDEAWGIFVVSGADLEALRRHFRQFLMARTPDGRRVYFRFYDPRVLPPFLEACSEGERERLFGPAASFGLVVRSEETMEMIRRPAAGGAAEPAAPGSPLFTLRPEHLRAFAPAAEEDLVRRLVAHLREEYPASDLAGLADPFAAERVRGGLARARHFGVEVESDLATFLAWMVEFAPDFDAHPAVRAVLTNTALPAPIRMRRLRDLPEEVWEEARDRADPSAWFLQPDE